jgi:hypothetical protein
MGRGHGYRTHPNIAIASRQRDVLAIVSDPCGPFLFPFDFTASDDPIG